MKSLQQLCLSIMVLFGSVWFGQAGVTLKQIEDLALKVEQGKRLSDADVRVLNKIKKKNPTLLSQSVWSELVSERIIARGIKSSNPNARKKNAAEKLRSTVAQDSTFVECDVKGRPDLIVLVEQFTQALNQVEYAEIDAVQKSYLSKIEASLSRANDLIITQQVLSIAIKYGIANLVGLLMSIGMHVTQNDLEHLFIAETMEHDNESAWFNAGADFARCKELFEAALNS